MKNKLILFGMYMVFVFFFLVLAECVFGQSPNRKVVFRTHTVDVNMSSTIDDMHDSDDIIYRDKGEVQYLNQTGSVDTIYTYYFKQPKKELHQCLGTTKNGVQCKRMTAQPYCYQHAEQQGIASK